MKITERTLIKMKKKKTLLAILSCAAALLVTGCGKSVSKSDLNSVKAPDESSSKVETTTTSSQKEDEKPKEDKIPDIPDQTIIGSGMTYTKFSSTKEAEDGKLSGGAKVAATRKDYHGKGYVTGIKTKDQWSVEFDLPQSQYYHVGIVLASDEAKKNGIVCDGKKLSDFTTTGNGQFEIITVLNCYIEQGKHTVTIEIPDEKLDIDYCFMTASEDIAKLDLTLKDPALSNKNSDDNAKALYNYICSVYGKSVLLAQHDTVSATLESDMMYKTTGKHPAIRFGDLMNITDKDSAEIMQKELSCAEKYAEQGGIVAYMWHWNSPSDKSSCYIAETDFDLAKAVTEENIAQKSIEELEKLAADKKISPQCLALIKDMDTAAQTLASLRDKGIPVIWRPLHEASNGYFWWGKDAKSYKWLWKLMYTRYTAYHKLNNLIWVWSAQSGEWYVGNDMCDMLSVDIYTENDEDSAVANLVYLQRISRNKPAAITECGNFPSIQNIADRKAYWSFIGQWGANYVLNTDGTLSQEHNTEKALQLMYNNNLTITREKLPSPAKMKEDLQKQEQLAKEKAEKEKAEKEKKEKEKASSSSKAE